ncbi:PPR domain-containing protein/PPR_2 domain-containing protein [Cephalotus follicularis]|uniref:PPR domain-containing protein/PPR_2 domain-containing protein n=1 Tax=Cephalotus follicularis TaxID=3775 RepID=A0A1Q3CDG0_CEPFO|nr:PPR domain-containing protein/PPR_2 domain-containing protein [Cephalotus follicularis]
MSSSMASSALPLPLSPSPPNLTSPSLPHHNHSVLYISKPPNQILKTPTIRSRLSKLCQEGQPQLARQLFDTIPRPTTVLWNTIIIGFICNNMPCEAILFYTQMKKSSPQTNCDSYTYSAALKACAETRNLKIDSEMGYGLGFDYSKYDLVRKVFDTMRKRNVVAWNTVISWYVKTERFEKAIKQFRMMMKMGIRPSAVSFVKVFPALSNIPDYDNANVVYGLLLKMGSEYLADFFVVSSAIFMYAELGRLDIARKIFDCCSVRNTEVCNTMIGGYVQNNCPAGGIEVFLQAVKSKQTLLDCVTFLSALSAVSQLQRVDLAKELHGYIIKNITTLPVILLNAIIVMYSRCNCIHSSFNVFHKMPERDVVSWNTMISSFVQNGLDEEGLLLVYEMQRQRFMADSVTVAAILSAASNLRNKEIGKQTHAYLLRHAIHSEGIGSYLIDMYAKSGLIRTARLFFEKNNSSNCDQATWNAMIAGYTQNGLIGEAFSAFRQMVEQNLMPNAVTLASVLPACNPIGNIDFGKQIHGFSVRHLLDQSVFVGTALVDMYSKSGAINFAENVFHKIPEKNSITYTSMILGYGQHGMGEKAISLFHSMHRFGIKPDAISLVAILSACSYAGLVDEGLQIFKSMESEYNIRPSIEHYCCLVDMLGRVGRVIEAYKLVKKLGEEGNVLEIWGSLLGACRLHGQFELGETVANKLSEMDTGINSTGYHVLLSNMYAKEGNWANVDRLRKEMREKGLRKEVGCSWIGVAGSVHCFVSKDREHPRCDDIYEILEGLKMVMKDAWPLLTASLGEISRFDV